MSYFKLSLNINDNCNLIEIYFINNNIKDDNIIDIELNENLLLKINKTFKKTKESKYVLYHKNNLSYIYDLSNDNQTVIIKKNEKDIFYNLNNKYNLYSIYYNENKLGTHYFPCTNDIDMKEEYIIKEFKINNRITLIIKDKQLFIQYKHNKTVDLDIINDTINYLIKKINNL